MVIGALAGVVAGILLSDRTLLAGLRKRRSGTRRDVGKARPLRPEGSTAGPSDRSPLDDEAELEARVLETFRNDPILVDRPIDIGAIGTGIIELTGWVDAATEVRHATTLTRGTIGVHTVVNRLLVRGGTPTV